RPGAAMRSHGVLWVGLLLGLGILGMNTFFVVDQRERAVLFQLGEIRKTDYAPGLQWKVPFLQSVQKFDSRILTFDSQVENFLTVEKKNVEVEYFIKWRIDDVTAYYRATGGQELVASDRLSATINRGLRDEFGSRTIQQAVGGEETSGAERDVIAEDLKKKAADNVRELGVAIVDVRIKSINLPKEVSDSVYDRMRAERTRVAADLRARGAEEAERIRADADRAAQITIADAYRDSEKLRGEGDAKAAEIYARAYGQDAEFYSFYRTLNVYRDTFKDKDDVLVLEPKGEFFKYFRGPGK
ncbi:MAG TPA: protease modulator HflC, partial [Nevskiaceae bacterium]|nr:protease modulator HflC [Nevskiaceae bacterium]